MSESIIVACITTAGLIIVAILQVRTNGKVNKIRDDAAITREQVANDHVDDSGKQINLREEQDERYASNSTLLHEIKSALGGIRDQLRQLTESDLALHRRADQNADRIHELEKTQPRNRKEPP